MRLVIFSSRDEAVELSRQVDVALGYPKPGQDIGKGVHAPAADSVTTSHSNVVDHPKEALFGYVVYDDDGLAAFQTARTACADKVATNQATAVETAIAQAPDEAEADDTWKVAPDPAKDPSPEQPVDPVIDPAPVLDLAQL